MSTRPWLAMGRARTQLTWMIVSGALVFGDWPAASTLIGAALVIACGVFLALRERRGEPAPRSATIDMRQKV